MRFGFDAFRDDIGVEQVRFIKRPCPKPLSFELQGLGGPLVADLLEGFLEGLGVGIGQAHLPATAASLMDRMQ